MLERFVTECSQRTLTMFVGVVALRYQHRVLITELVGWLVVIFIEVFLRNINSVDLRVRK